MHFFRLNRQILEVQRVWMPIVNDGYSRRAVQVQTYLNNEDGVISQADSGGVTYTPMVTC